MELTISSVDYAPEDLHGQMPLVLRLVRELPGPDRPDYWLATAATPIKWLHGNHERLIKHVILAARWQGTRIEAGVRNLPVGIAFVTDESLLDAPRLDFSKFAYVAIGISDDLADGPSVEAARGILAGTIGRFFGMGE